MIYLLWVVTDQQVPSEEAVFEAVISWIKQDENNRKDSLPNMLEYVRLPLLTPRYLTDTVDNEVGHRFALILMNCFLPKEQIPVLMIDQ